MGWGEGTLQQVYGPGSVPPIERATDSRNPKAVLFWETTSRALSGATRIPVPVGDLPPPQKKEKLTKI